MQKIQWLMNIVKNSADYKSYWLVTFMRISHFIRWQWDYVLQITATVLQKLFKHICRQVSSLESLWTFNGAAAQPSVTE